MTDEQQDRCAAFNKGTPVRRKWGYYVDHLREDNLVIKTLVIEPNQAISYQRHNKREEAWLIAEGVGLLTVDLETERVSLGMSFYIDAGQWHTIQNLSSEHPLVIVEVQSGDPCDEEDIERM